MHRFTVKAALALAGAALSLAACGEDRDGDEGGGSGAATKPAPRGAMVKVSETEYKMTPASPRLARTGATTFEVRNDGKIAHALEVEGPGGERETDSIAPGKSATLKVDLSRPGRYEWYCPIADHRDRGMKGEIAVGGGPQGKAEDKPKDEPEKRDDSGGGGGGGGY